MFLLERRVDMTKRQWLENIRNEKNLTHSQVASFVNISRQHYGLIENGERDPSVSVAKKIATLFGFDWTIFFDDEGYKKLQKTNDFTGRTTVHHA